MERSVVTASLRAVESSSLTCIPSCLAVDRVEGRLLKKKETHFIAAVGTSTTAPAVSSTGSAVPVGTVRPVFKAKLTS